MSGANPLGHGLPELTRSALQLASELLTALHGAREILAPFADTHEAAGLAFQLIADACASAEPPPAVEIARTDEEGDAAGHPLVRAVHRAFPGSTVADVRTRFIGE